MPFPFLPFGALFGALVLLATLTVFGMLAFVVDRTVTEIGTSILPGLVAGVGAWGSRPDPRPLPSSGAAEEPDDTVHRLPGGASIEELPVPTPLAMARVRDGRRRSAGR